jgi:hypothetical protein
MTIPCACLGGATGVQTCNAAGSYESCACAEADGGALDGSPTDATMSLDSSVADGAPDALSDGPLLSDGALTDAATADSDATQPADGGLDATSDGVTPDSGGSLDASDVYVPDPCSVDGGAVLQGSFTISNGIDVATLAPYCEVTGDLTIAAPGLTSLSLPNLAVVDGLLSTSTGGDGGASNLVTLDLPALVRVGGFDIAAPALTTLEVPQLAIAGSPPAVGVSIIAPSLSSLSLPSLAAAGNISVSTPQITTLTLPALQSAGAIGVGAFGAPSLSLPVLASATDISVSHTAGSANCASIQAPLLTAATAIGVSDCTVDFPMLSTCAFVSTGAGSTAALKLPKLKSTQLAIYGAIQSLDLSGLETLTGPGPCSPLNGTTNCALLVYPGGVQSLSLPVTQILGDVQEFHDLSLPAVTSISGAVYVPGSFSAPSLSRIGGDTTLGGPADLPALATVGGTLFTYQWTQSTLGLPVLQSAGSLEVTDASGLATVSLPMLATISGTFQVERDPALTQLLLPKLASVGARNMGVLQFLSDPTFPQACAQELYNQLVAKGFQGTLSAGAALGTGACPY